MKANVIPKPESRKQDRKEDQMAIYNLADDQAIVNVVTMDDGKYLCFTDNKGAKLNIHMPRPVLDQQKAERFAAPKGAFPNTCQCGCGCEYRRFGGHKMLYLPNSSTPCPHH